MADVPSCDVHRYGSSILTARLHLHKTCVCDPLFWICIIWYVMERCEVMAGVRNVNVVVTFTADEAGLG